MDKWKQIVLLFLFSALYLFACGKVEAEVVTELITNEETTETEEPETAPDELSLTAETNLSDIEQEIEEYRMHFIELYTSNAMEETEDRINIEEMEIDYGDNGEPATLIKYTDLSGEKLRYQLQFYGETGRCSIDYYLCKDFLLISKKYDYYSSWVLTADYSDVLYSTIDNWVVIDENTYILHSDGELEKIEKTQLGAPMLEEIETYVEGSEEVYAKETEFCGINDFEDFHYYLFCNTNISLGTTPTVINAFIGNEGETMETGIELYQKYMEPLRTDDHEENMELYYISPDCKLSVTREEPVRGDHMITRWSSFDGG